MERTQIYMHDHLPEFSALLTVLAYLFLKNIPNIIYMQLSFTALAEATALSIWAAIIGWCIRYVMDNRIKLFSKFKKPKNK